MHLRQAQCSGHAVPIALWPILNLQILSFRGARCYAERCQDAWVLKWMLDGSRIDMR